MTSDNNKLSWRQKTAIRAMLTNPDLDSVADSVGVTVRTVYRWLDSDAFRAALLEHEGDVIDHVTRRLLLLAGQALDVLEIILQDSDAPIAQRRQAAESILSHLVKLRELRDLEHRLTALERRVYGTAA